MGYNIFAGINIIHKKFMRVKTGKEFTENIIMGIFFAGVIPIAASYFAATAIPKIIKLIIKSRKKRQSFCNTFYKLKKQGYINIQSKNHQLYISLTPEGRKKAGRLKVVQSLQK